MKLLEGKKGLAVGGLIVRLSVVAKVVYQYGCFIGINKEWFFKMSWVQDCINAVFGMISSFY